MATVVRPSGLAQRRETKFEQDLRKFKDGQAGAVIRQDYHVVSVTDNTATKVFTVTVPNAIMGGGIGILLTAQLGDGDSVETSYWTIAVSRIAGAATKAVVSAKSSNANTVGATGNAAGTITVSAMTGAVTATQTFNVQVTVARSAGTSDNHVADLSVELMNASSTAASSSAAAVGITMSV